MKASLIYPSRIILQFLLFGMFNVCLVINCNAQTQEKPKKNGNKDKSNMVTGVLYSTLEGEFESLEVNILDSTQAETVSLIDKNLTQFPKELFNFNNLQSLYLDTNKIEKISKKINRLQTLKELSLSNNQIESLPKNLGKLGNLTSLDLSFNKLQNIPAELGNLQKLTWLNLSYNQLKSLPNEFTQLSDLTYLDLSYNNFKELPQGLENLKNLIFLDVRGNSPPVLQEAHKLKVLHIEDTDKMKIASIKKGRQSLVKFDRSKIRIANNVIYIPSDAVLAYGDEISLWFYRPFLDIEYEIGTSKLRFLRPSEYQDYLWEDDHANLYIDADIIEYHYDTVSTRYNESTYPGWIYDFYAIDPERNPVTLTSSDYFNLDEFERLGENLKFHPLKLIASYLERNTNQDIEDEYYILKQENHSFKLSDLSDKYYIPIDVLELVFKFLNNQAYLTLDRGIITLKRRFYHAMNSYNLTQAVGKYGKEAFNKLDSAAYYENDFDNIKIIARTNKGNNIVASTLIKDPEGGQEWTIHHTGKVYLEHSSIENESKNQNLRIYGGRNIYFEACKAKIGNVNVEGRDFFLLYDELRLEMPIVDKITFIDEDTTQLKTGIIDVIDLKPGGITLQDRFNKSGLKRGKIPGTNVSYEDYPNLSIPQGGETYFPGLDSSSVYARVDPIDFYNLDINSDNPIQTFHSTIFPNFEITLETFPNNRGWGFIHQPPENGYPLYPSYRQLSNAVIKFNTELKMGRSDLDSNYLLSGGGRINYLTTELKSPEFIFYPDSLVSDNVNFSITSDKINGCEFANVRGKNAHLDWLIREDRMLLSNKTKLYQLEDALDNLSRESFAQRYKENLFTLYSYDNPITLRGNLDVGSNGLRGEGYLIRKDFSILSVTDYPFKFQQSKFTADNVEFRINSTERDLYTFDQGQFYTDNKVILLANFIDVDFNIAQGKAFIKPDEEFSDFSSLSLPYAEFRTSIKEAVWDIDKKVVNLIGDTNSYFTSTIFGWDDLNEENLTFKGSSASYDLTNHTLTVEGIPFINSADALIIPKDGKVVILKDSEIQELKEARVLIDTLNRYHRLVDATILIKSRLYFEGNATYQFVNDKQDTFNIKFNELEILEDTDDTNKDEFKNVVPRYIFAQGTVIEQDSFYITSQVLFKGQIKMYSNLQHLILDGFLKLDVRDDKRVDEWVPYQGNSNSKNLMKYLLAISQTKQNNPEKE